VRGGPAKRGIDDDVKSRFYKLRDMVKKAVINIERSAGSKVKRVTGHPCILPALDNGELESAK